jgi:hypothetical protein
MKRILVLLALCGAITGCEIPEHSLTYNESAQRKAVCSAKGGEYVYTMSKIRQNSPVSSRCKIDGVEFEFWYGRYTGSTPQL